MGTRPRVAVEVRPEGVVAARAEGASGLLAAISRDDLREGVLRPGLRAGNVAERTAVSGALRRTLDGVAAKGGDRSKYVSLVVPDAAVRVLLLDFDALPSKAAEALAVVRFRLKKLLPFDAEHAVVSYQVMSSGRDGVRVLAVAMPCDVLSEYEALVMDAGYLSGAVLPSTLAALAGLDGDDDGTARTLVVNAGPGTVTTAIVQGGVLLLHRTVDMGAELGGDGIEIAPGSSGPPLNGMREGDRLPLPVREGSVDDRLRPDSSDYDRMDAETEIQSQALREMATSLPSESDQAVQALHQAEPVSTGREITQAVSVAAAYFEDTLGGPPAVVVAAGTLGAERLRAVLAMYGMDGLRVREMIDTSAIGVGASTSTVPHGWMAGVRGALRS